MTMLYTRARYEALKTLPFGDVGHGAYAQIQDMAGVETSAQHAIRTYTIQNYTDEDALFSLDGVTPFLYLPSGESFTEDLSSNQALAAGFVLPKGTTIWVQDAGAAPGSGAIYWTILYASND